ncbi:MAG: class I SAM-dependent methyltransferase [Patescibacteria group bacterium]
MKKLKPTRGYGLLERPLSKERIKMANKLILPESRLGSILDIGCGVNPLFLLKTPFRIKYGIDSAIKKLNYGQNIFLNRMDIEENEKLPFSNNFFDVITMLAVIEHIDPSKVLDILKEIHRILKPNCRFILSTPCPWSDFLLKFMSKIKLVSKKEIDDHKTKYGQKKIILLLQKSGFSIKNIRAGYFEIFLNNWAYANKSF